MRKNKKSFLLSIKLNDIIDIYIDISIYIYIDNNERVLYQKERVLYVFIILYLVIRLVYRVNCQSDFPIKNQKQ